MRFPVMFLFAEPGCGFDVVDDRDAMETTGKRAIREGWFLGARIIDSAGNLYRVQSVRQRPQAFWEGWSLLRERRIKVDLECEAMPSDWGGLASLKQELIDRVRKDATYWSASKDVEEYASDISSAPTFESLFRVFPP